MNATKLPTTAQFAYFDWQNAFFLRAPQLETGGTYTLYFTVAPTDKDGVLIDGGFTVTSFARNGKTYSYWVPVGNVSADGLSATGCVGGIRPTGWDYTTGDSDFLPPATVALAGAKIVCGLPAVVGELIRQAVQGNIATGGSRFIIGTDASGDVTIAASTGVGTYSDFIKRTSAGVAQYWNGSSWVNFSDTQSSVTAKVSAADTTADYLFNKIDVATDGELTKAIGSPASAETIQLGLATTLTKAEMDALHTGISANVTGTNLATLTAGGASNADALHTHSALPIASGTAGEDIDGSSTPVVVSRMPNDYRDYVYVAATTAVFQVAGGGSSGIPVGNVDANTRVGMSFTYTDTLASSISLSKITLELSKTGTPADNYYIEIQTDSGGAPSGTVVTNGTSANLLASSMPSTSREIRQFTFSTPPTLVSGTTYWVVLRRSGANDASNYLNTYRNNADSVGYTTKTYTASSTTWSAALASDLNLAFEYKINYGGKIVKADYSNPKKANVVGVSTDNVLSGATVDYFVDGAIVGGFSGLTAGATYYANTAGGYTTTPTFTIPTTTASITVAGLFKVFEAISATQVKINLGAKISFVAIGANNLISNNLPGSSFLFSLPVTCGFQPDETTIYRFAGSASIAELIKCIQSDQFFDTSSISVTPSVFFPTTVPYESGMELNVQMSEVDNNSFGALFFMKKQ